MLVKDVVQKTTAFFRDKGIPSARLDAELLIANALKWPRIQLYLKFDYPMSETELAVCREVVRRRAHGEPVAYIVGSRDFYDRTFLVEPGVLVPRPETEGLVEAAVSHLKKQDLGERSWRVLDLGCGSGCIGLSVAAEVAEARVLCVDVSEVAERVTLANRENLGLTERALVRLSAVEALGRADIEAALGGLADVVLANPPYVAENDERLAPDVRKHEPGLALFSADDGLRHIREWAFKAAEFSQPGALVVFEIGSGQGAAARTAFAAVGAFRAIEIQNDLAGHERFVRAERGEVG